jgi:NADP-dependent 3-hydroxy acid dehydrogenase YdfG
MSLIAITGASAGIGASIARRFDINGNKIVLLARRKQKLEELKAQLHNSEVFIYELDVSSRKRVEMVFDLIEKEHGSIDILVNNAGLVLHTQRAC